MVHFESDGDVASMTRIVLAVANYAEARILSEVHGWAEKSLEMSVETGTKTDPELVGTVARFLSHAGDLARISELMATIDDTGASCHVLMGSIVRDWFEGRPDKVTSSLSEGLIEQGGTGGYWELTFNLLAVYSATALGTDPLPALSRLETLAITGGDVAQICGLAASANQLFTSGETERSIERSYEAIEQAEKLGLAGLAQIIGSSRSVAVVMQPDPKRAARAVAESMARGVENGSWSLVATDLGLAAEVLTRANKGPIAAALIGARRAAGYSIPSTRVAEEQLLSTLGKQLGEQLHVQLDQGGLLDMETAARLGIEALRP